jgi:MYXO-CTERM domain-containing protein
MSRETLGKWPHWPWIIWAAYLIVLTGFEWAYGRQFQAAAYHQFADTRTWLGIPRFGDVVSNAALLLAGLYGFAGWRRRRSAATDERIVQAVFYVGVLMTAFGSTYYHWAPDSARLVWDRLPLGLLTVCFPALVLADRSRFTRLSRWAMWAWLAWGVLSVVYWWAGDAQGQGDLRPYGLLKFYGILGALGFLAILQRRHTLGIVYAISLGMYVLAVVTEAADSSIYSATGWISGHTLKHLLAGLGVAAVAWMYSHRETLPEAGASRV